MPYFWMFFASENSKTTIPLLLQQLSYSTKTYFETDIEKQTKVYSTIITYIVSISEINQQTIANLHNSNM